MEILKNPRLWVTIIVLGGVLALALKGIVGGDAALSALLGVAGGWGVAAAGKGGKQ